ncbi:MAG: hypothetical protein LKF54_02715 [Bacilli bacterium]|jgi:hypothetical protein|nr:hypothetical protein [Bacilli bacterium]
MTAYLFNIPPFDKTNLVTLSDKVVIGITSSLLVLVIEFIMEMVFKSLTGIFVIYSFDIANVWEVLPNLTVKLFEDVYLLIHH